jgi:NHS family xanthosine MFS transporter
MLIAMFAWVLRFALFGAGDPGSGVWMFVLSCIVYGFAFDFFNISGALYVDQETSPEMRSSAQGLFMMMTNGVGATIGTLAAQGVVNKCVPVVSKEKWDFLASLENGVEAVYNQAMEVWQGWQTAWYIFAAYALVVAILFWIFFPKTPVKN